MIQPKFIFVLLLPVVLFGCAGHTESWHQLLPHDEHSLPITVPGKLPIRFVAPTGWKIIQQPERTQNFTYVLSRSGSLEEPNLSVSCEPDRTSPHTTEQKLQEERLRSIRGHGKEGSWGSAGYNQDSFPYTADGRVAWVYHWVGDDGEQLVAIIPENGFKTEIILWAQTPEQIVANRQAYLALVHTYSHQ